jgi:hypothetical protein
VPARRGTRRGSSPSRASTRASSPSSPRNRYVFASSFLHDSIQVPDCFSFFLYNICVVINHNPRPCRALPFGLSRYLCLQPSTRSNLNSICSLFHLPIYPT